MSNIRDIFDCKDITVFTKTIVSILPYEGESKSLFCICEYNGNRFLVKLCLYYKPPIDIYGQTQGLMHPADAEISILKVLKKDITDKNLSACILESIYTQTCEGIIDTVSRNCDKYNNDILGKVCKYIDFVNSGLAQDKYAYIVLDACNISLYDFLKQYTPTAIGFAILKSIIFSLTHAFYVIGKIFPGFHHSDLHSRNVMLKYDSKYIFDMHNPMYLVFEICGAVYTVPYFGIIPKIIDFDRATIPEKNIESMLYKDALHKFYRARNDLLILFNSIYVLARDSHVDELLSLLDTTGSYINYDAVDISKIEDKIPSYECMIKSAAWTEYRRTPKSKKQIYHRFSPI